jgi:hypothetical protein
MNKPFNGSLSINLLLPKPIAFNCWKHHLEFVKSTLDLNSSFRTSHLDIHEIVQHIGESNVDFYYGILDPEAISNQVISYLETVISINNSDFNLWVNSNGTDYKCIKLSDGSNWTLRLGLNAERYIHIHPSRYSKKTVRVKSSTLKTVIAYFYTYGILDNQISVEKVNRIRNKIVKLPCLKPSSPLIAVSRFADRFFS